MRASCRWCSLNLQLIFSKKHPKLKTNQMWICISLYIFSLLFRSSSLSFSAEMFLRWVSFLSFSIGPQKQGPPTLLIFVGLIDSHHVSVRYDLFIFICLIFVYIYICALYLHGWIYYTSIYMYMHEGSWRAFVAASNHVSPQIVCRNLHASYWVCWGCPLPHLPQTWDTYPLLWFSCTPFW